MVSTHKNKNKNQKIEKRKKDATNREPPNKIWKFYYSYYEVICRSRFLHLCIICSHSWRLLYFIEIEVELFLWSWVMHNIQYSAMYKTAPVVLQAEQINFLNLFTFDSHKSQVYDILHIKWKENGENDSFKRWLQKEERFVSFLMMKLNPKPWVMRTFMCLAMCAKM